MSILKLMHPSRFAMKLRNGDALWLLLVIFLVKCPRPSFSYDSINNLTFIKYIGNEMICPSLRITDSTVESKQLDPFLNCTIVDGHVWVVMTDTHKTLAMPSSSLHVSILANISFKHLREIANHLFVYQNKALQTLSSLFPQLTVIRGQQLFHDFALLIYQFGKQRCITLEECMTMNPPLDGGPKSKREVKLYKIWDGSCILDCPANTTEHCTTEDGIPNRQCSPCHEKRCPKICKGNMLDSVEKAKALHGCTYIAGQLEIQITAGDDVVSELEKNLDSIEEIRDYLKVARSGSLLSLNFLKHLRWIGGQVLEDGKYAIKVLDNPNLQQLWDWDKRGMNVTIERGEISFTHNPKLCLSHIEAFWNRSQNVSGSHTVPPLPEGVDNTTNGDQAACNVAKIWAQVSEVMQDNRSVGYWQVDWENYRLGLVQPRDLVNYVVSYREAPSQNVSIYDGRDACSKDKWTDIDVKYQYEGTNKYVRQILTILKPATQYALYVHTYMIRSSPHVESKGAMSEILYFTTRPISPGTPRDVVAWGKSDSELVVEWAPPAEENGVVTEYQLRIEVIPQSVEEQLQKEYCQDGFIRSQIQKNQLLSAIEIKTEDEKRLMAKKEKEEKLKYSSDCCACEGKNRDVETYKRQVQFQDNIMNDVFVRKHKDKVTVCNRGPDQCSIKCDDWSLLVSPIPSMSFTSESNGNSTMLKQRKKRSVEEGFTHVPNSLRDELRLDQELQDAAQKEEQTPNEFTDGNRLPPKSGKLPKEHVETPVDFIPEN
ncbi:unnamed protein product [Darwinula stevensoni]|uniref:Receptor L-domain domain-containing protein n=1 Tax=Darwinula stevensoni TaxID=69355 RepID=A0A7R8X090_9CRUS|nr:unnamed protein product [Darwinula stevensoni]CAG0878938.1 unnamed protein product [Darwinula stevensoni]